jgi:hypothetical protein
MPVEYRDEIRSGVDVKSLGDARSYIARLQGISKQRAQATPPTTTVPTHPQSGTRPPVTTRATTATSR